MTLLYKEFIEVLQKLANVPTFGMFCNTSYKLDKIIEM